MEFDTESYHRFSGLVKDWVATAGIMYFCQENACFWILDVLVSYVPTLVKLNADYLKIIEVVVEQKSGNAVFTIRDEINGELVRQDIHTDLPVNVVFWAITETDKTVVLLPSEY